jgi:hypothetical protein
VNDVSVVVPEGAHPLPPGLVGRREHLLGALSAQALGRPLDVVGIEPESECTRGIVGGPFGDGDPERLEPQEGEGRLPAVLPAERRLEAEGRPLEVDRPLHVVDVDDRERLPEGGHGLPRRGAGSPYASCHETIGFRRTPMRSISASITSPGLRYSDSASSLNPATPETVPVESTSPAL